LALEASWPAFELRAVSSGTLDTVGAHFAGQVSSWSRRDPDEFHYLKSSSKAGNYPDELTISETLLLQLPDNTAPGRIIRKPQKKNFSYLQLIAPSFRIPPRLTVC